MCPHLPDARCACRKPEPRSLLDARDRFAIDPAASWVIGDHAVDVRLGWSTPAAAASCCSPDTARRSATSSATRRWRRSSPICRPLRYILTDERSAR